ncbi:hypothetical protein OG601_34075 [Streptomyces sp. NBC_01239]|uniref:hypothetical protein n=1 Tax=Streptomyces sp. NBC_01239 TaxID=2903792 RepID=UPI0022592E1E|nr:hypothetical protein [Streptomyces sp. NBC_01239]MCX4815636.1 hypothetical protein [Streptomyces sp. NBC_01239]
MLSGLDALARSTANARLTGPVVDTRGNRVTVTVLDSMVRVYAVAASHNRVLDLIRNVPNESSTDDNFFVGREGYEALSRVANQCHRRPRPPLARTRSPTAPSQAAALLAIALNDGTDPNPKDEL